MFLLIFIDILYIHMIFLSVDNYLDDIESEFDSIVTPKIYMVTYFSSIAAMVHLGKMDQFYINLIIFLVMSLIVIKHSVNYKSKLLFMIMFSLISISFHVIQVFLYDIYGIIQMVFIGSRLVLIGGVIFLNIFIQVIMRIIIPYFNFLNYNINFRKTYLIIVISSILIIFLFYAPYPFVSSGFGKIIEILTLIGIINTVYIMNYLIIILQMNYNKKIINDTEIRVQHYNYSLRQFKDNLRMLRKMRHDMKNHIIVLYSLVKNNKYEEFFRYVDQINLNHKLVLTNALITSIPAVDIIIDNKLTEARNIGTKVDLKTHLPYDIRIDEFDMVTIIGNILDNSIHAISELDVSDRYILFSIKVINDNAIIIDVHNTYKDKNTGDKVKFGTGLENVQEVVNKYNGFMHILKEEKLFKIRVMLYNRK